MKTVSILSLTESQVKVKIGKEYTENRFFVIITNKIEKYLVTNNESRESYILSSAKLGWYHD